MKTKYMMIVREKRLGVSWEEGVPDSINYKFAPDITEMGPVNRAKTSIQWWNKTRKPYENERELVSVTRVTEEEIYNVES
ncbi:hypothetical protein P10VF_029 [Rhizobium phage vB_RleM_P10VF]|uniref:Uncharacterized protein n=1 Tax=Rhizobium phage vB_RleM_P10VF TaxID=1527770 RepID=A0A076YKF2_9CAUD|nr:hypothetical protein P10VF_029 [Rhizobium phage vB_RleM_P10VF]AIK68242.1 hypothetical protein P10VF_029 [Rhizobium phage vB_RleM_P10VF]